MIAVDTSTWIAFLQGAGGGDAELLDKALSDPKLSPEVSETLSELPLIEVRSGYWQRAGELRARVVAKRRKAASC